MSQAELTRAMRPYRDRDAIPLPELLGPLGVDRYTRHYLIEHGLIRPLPDRGPRRVVMVDQSEAQRVMRAALIALAAGVALAAALRVLDAAAHT